MSCGRRASTCPASVSVSDVQSTTTTAHEDFTCPWMMGPVLPSPPTDGRPRHARRHTRRRRARTGCRQRRPRRPSRRSGALSIAAGRSSATDRTCVLGRSDVRVRRGAGTPMRRRRALLLAPRQPGPRCMALLLDGTVCRR
jgi:hypothetical protein